MQLIGQAIRHETFGKGIVTGWNRNILTVCFPGGDKRFLYPDAFARRHLTLRNQEMQAEIQELLLAKEAEKQEAQQAMQEEQERRALLQHMKLSKMSQAAFDVEEGQLNALFSEWVISTGTYISGASKGEPRVPARMKPNSLCLITHRGTRDRAAHPWYVHGEGGFYWVLLRGRADQSPPCVSFDPEKRGTATFLALFFGENCQTELGECFTEVFFY